MELQFNGPYGVYHSMYDDYYWMNHFGDPGYRYHTLTAQLWGTLALRLANADVLPYDFEFCAGNIRQFLHELDAKSHLGRHVDLQPLFNRIAKFEVAGHTLNRAVARALAAGHLDAAVAERSNQELIQVERNWLNPAGIPGRPWFKHTLYAARYTYAHLELPGLTEAAEAADWQRAQEQERVVENQLERNTELLARARADLEALL
jgi:N-acetylated-alpha-linked acidic dipeptidase